MLSGTEEPRALARGRKGRRRSSTKTCGRAGGLRCCVLSPLHSTQRVEDQLGLGIVLSPLHGTLCMECMCAVDGVLSSGLQVY